MEYAEGRKERMCMKNRRRFQAMAVVLAGTFALSVSGCEKIVKSAVVKEKEEQQEMEQSRAEQETAPQKEMQPDDLQNDSGMGRGDLSVAEQVQAPEFYQADFTDISEGSQLKLHVSANALVEVPDVESVFLKQAVRSSGDAERMRSWVDALSMGAEVRGEKEDIENTSGAKSFLTSGNATINGVPFQYWYRVLEEGSPTMEIPGFYWGVDWDKFDSSAVSIGLPAAEEGTMTKEEQAFLEKASADVEELLKMKGLTDFHISQKTLMYGNYQGENGVAETCRVPVFRCERLVDGIPVTYVQTAFYPIYKDPEYMIQGGGGIINAEPYNEQDGSGESTSEEDASSGKEEGAWRWWEQEWLFIHYNGENIFDVTYGEPMEITAYSDEEQFLLPFEEIRQVFENTIAARLTGPEREELLDYGSVLFMYPHPDSSEVDMEITKVKLGYMRIREDASSIEGILIPVWDFFGKWTAKGTDEAGNPKETVMEEENISLLTIDARDGSVIQRYRGY